MNFCVNAGLKINKNKEAENIEGIRTVWDEIREETAAAEKKRAGAAIAELSAVKTELAETKAKLAAN